MALETKYDSIIEQERGEIPLAFVKALIYNESRFDPNAKAKTSNAMGLMQIMPVVMNDYNKRYGTSVVQSDLTQPELNIRIGCDLLNRIVKAYRTNHPESLATDWNSERFVKLLVFGWNAGYSQAAGVQFVVGKMEANGLKGNQITVESVSLYSRAAGASKNLANTAKVRYAGIVAKTYFKEIGRPFAEPVAMAKPSGGAKLGFAIGLLGLMGLGGLIRAKAKKRA